MSKTSNHRSSAFLMAVYTFLLALGAALPLAASYSERIESRNAETHIQGGAYQRRVQVRADASDQVGVESPDRAVQLDGADADAEELESASGCGPSALLVESRGS